jgi:hypothetical protein
MPLNPPKLFRFSDMMGWAFCHFLSGLFSVTNWVHPSFLTSFFILALHRISWTIRPTLSPIIAYNRLTVSGAMAVPWGNSIADLTCRRS